jgi:hypothetical protein
VGLLGYGWLGLWVWDVTRYYLLSLAPVAAAVLLGRAANRRLDARAFLVYVHCGLIVIGAMLLLQSVWL